MNIRCEIICMCKVLWAVKLSMLISNLNFSIHALILHISGTESYTRQTPKENRFSEFYSWRRGSASLPRREAVAGPTLGPPLSAMTTPTECWKPYRRVTSGRLLSLAAPKMASIMEGPLSKWTNVMKGWQYRWFVLDYNAGLLSYYTVSPWRQIPGCLGSRDSSVEVGNRLFGSPVEVARMGVPPYGRVPS